MNKQIVSSNYQIILQSGTTLVGGVEECFSEDWSFKFCEVATPCWSTDETDSDWGFKNRCFSVACWSKSCFASCMDVFPSFDGVSCQGINWILLQCQFTCIFRKRTILLHSIGIISRTSPLKLRVSVIRNTTATTHNSLLVLYFLQSNWFLINNAGISQIDGNAWSSLQSDCRRRATIKHGSLG